MRPYPVDAERPAAQAVADTDLPLAGAQREHLLGNLTHGRENHAPGEFRRGIGRTAGMLIGRYDDSATRTGVDVDMRVHAALTDEP